MSSSVAVLFDLDGILVDTRVQHLAAWDRFAREANITVEPGYFHKSFGLRNDTILGRLLPEQSREAIDELGTRKEEIFRQIARDDIELLPGVRELLEFLDVQHVPKAVVTSTPRPNLNMILETLNIGAHFQALVAAEDTRRGKPDPEGFLLAASRLGVPADGSVVIEDAPAGIEAAKAGGMRAIAVTTTHPAPDLRAADLVVESLSEEDVRTFILR